MHLLVEALSLSLSSLSQVGGSEIVTRLVDGLKDESEPYRKMVMETIEKVVTNMGTADIDQRLEEQVCACTRASERLCVCVSQIIGISVSKQDVGT